jgi:cytochrome c-type biogenesis protein CcmH/NrfG
MTKLTAPLRLLSILVALAAFPALAQAPAQEEPKNLQVLPKDWSRAQVVAVMQNINAALGVACDYCHVQNQGSPPDFAADDKAEKMAARAMMKLTGELNTDLVAALERPAAEVTRVGCITCHRGVPVPKQLAEILARTSAEKGFAAASAQYNELKAKYYGAQAYDFSEAGLIATAQPLVPARVDEAIQFLNLNLGLFPQSARTYVALANAQVAKQDSAGAIASLEKALAIEPNNAAARRQLDQLRR